MSKRRSHSPPPELCSDDESNASSGDEGGGGGGGGCSSVAAAPSRRPAMAPASLFGTNSSGCGSESEGEAEETQSPEVTELVAVVNELLHAKVAFLDFVKMTMPRPSPKIEKCCVEMTGLLFPSALICGLTRCRKEEAVKNLHTLQFCTCQKATKSHEFKDRMEVLGLSDEKFDFNEQTRWLEEIKDIFRSAMERLIAFAAPFPHLEKDAKHWLTKANSKFRATTIGHGADTATKAVRAPRVTNEDGDDDFKVDPNIPWYASREECLTGAPNLNYRRWNQFA